ncbi:short-subunit dehydrogenase [Buttiauxella sp. BIGb0471]|uniref:SDR family NAD(P)-dependent oxidoreductase n=1 Tax=Buttiauxella sp. BIGb0471 TaxID=2940597 RepID=UPI002169B0F6|nr:SDR family oxidoreductase [Buttiauxella sp. BIGb0471]MCS3602467.1 short-subunit dehydrogenase [Buttiauxella sp. BIGb0471]
MTTSPSVAVITGASSGIGAVYAERFAVRGYDLLLVARREERLQELANKLQALHGINVEILPADLADERGIQAVEEAIRRTDHIEVLVNNAGTAHIAPFVDGSVELHLADLMLNITALTRLSLAALTRFKAQNSGTIINIASVVSLNATAGSAVYSGTKGYVLNFTRGLQEEVAGSNVRIQAVLPAITATEIWGVSGVSMDILPPEAIMTSENMVDAALAGLENGEAVTIPALHDLAKWEAYESARLAIYHACLTGVPAPRYKQ